MIINFHLDKEDFLRYQLYMVVQMPRIRKSRRRKRWTFPVIFALFGLIFLTIHKSYLAFTAWFLALLWFSFYPILNRKKYQKFYADFVEEHYGNRFGKDISIDFREDKIIGRDNGLELKIRFKELEEIIELPTLLLLKINPQQHIIIAKNKLESPKSLVELLVRLAGKWQVPFKVSV
ncbi:MAG TPA: hypothetical protein VFL76_01305 [Edaphocola sp.]|nr:hypothetical protein [Edaphocola sp.]